MKHISIYWERDSSDLVDMFQSLGNLGQTCGNDGCELAVTDEELARIEEYIREEPGKFTLEVKTTNEKNLTKYVQNWQELTAR